MGRSGRSRQGEFQHTLSECSALVLEGGVSERRWCEDRRGELSGDVLRQSVL